MYNYDKVMNGIASFIDEEIVSKMHDWRGWVVGSALGLSLSKFENIFNTLKDNEFVKMLGIIEGNNVDVDSIYKELKRQAAKGDVKISIPMIGDIKLSERDVDSLYGYIIRD